MVLRHSPQPQRRPHLQQGFIAIEVIVATGLVGTLLLATLGAVSVAGKNARVHDDGATAALLARSQMEAIKSLPFVAAPSVYPTVTPPFGFSLTVQTFTVPGGDANLERVQVDVVKDGQTLQTLEAYKVNR